MVVVGFVTGRVKYYETWSAPGESRGYIGRASHILDDPEELAEVFDELYEEFPNQDIETAMFNVSNDEVMAAIRNPDKPTEADYYYFEGTFLFRRGWHKGQPYRMDTFGFDGYPVNAIDPSGITAFYEQIQTYLTENDVEESENHPYTINVQNLNGELHLRADFRGIREDIHFAADIDGDNFRTLAN